MASADGITWRTLTGALEDNGWQGLCWAPELAIFCAVAGASEDRYRAAKKAARSTMTISADYNTVYARPSQLYVSQATGYVGIGTSNPTARLDVAGAASEDVSVRVSSDSDRSAALLLSRSNATQSSAWQVLNKGGAVYGSQSNDLGFVHNGSNLMSLSAGAGSLDCLGNVTSYSASLSDSNFKRDVATYGEWRGPMDRLRPVSFTWRDDAPVPEKRGQSDIGFLAQEVALAYPLAHDRRVMMDGTDVEIVRCEKLIPLMVAAIKGLQQQVAELQGA
jgi:hypothetical protein